MISCTNTKLKSQVKICSAKNCYNTSENKPNLNFFLFPKQLAYARIWATNANRHDLTTKQSCVFEKHFLCSEHFMDKYLDRKFLRKPVLLRDLNPIPTIFNNPNIKLEIDIKEEELDKKIIELDVNTIGQQIPVYVPDESLRPSTQWGKMNYTDDVYEYFLTNPKPDQSDRLIIRDYCRLCSKQLPLVALIPIFGSTRFLNYGDMLEYILPGEFKKDDSYPQQICSMCITKLEAAYITVKGFQKSNKYLKKILDIRLSEPDKRSLITTDVENKEEKRRKFTTDEESNEERTIVFTEPKEEIKSVTPINAEKKEEISEIASSIEYNKEKNCEEQSSDENGKNINQTRDVTNTEIINTQIVQNEEKIQTKYQCLKCLKLFNNETEIRNHLTLEHSETNCKFRIVKVKLCKKKEKRTPPNSKQIIEIIDSTSESSDLEIKKPLERFYYVWKRQCLKCSKAFSLEKFLISHTKEMHPELEHPLSKLIKVRMKRTTSISSFSRYECLICHTQHSTKYAFVKHSRQQHPGASREKIIARILKSKKYNCLRCNTTFESYNKYEKHMLKHAIHKCEPCGITFDKIHKLNRHKEKHKHSDIIKCDICSETFASRFELRRHKRIHEAALCNICGKLFSSEQNLKYHILTHSDSRTFKCTTCTKSFKTPAGLSKHKECHEQIKKYVCQICGKLFRTTGSMKQHLQGHKKDKKHACEICGVKFSRRGNVMKHMERHNIINKVYKCQICDQQYNNYQNLIFHSCTSNSERHRCTVCEKTFISIAQLKLHQKIHNMQRLFQCEHCAKSFFTKQGLKTHKNCLSDYNYQCEQCDKKFRKAQSLELHRKNHEKTVEDTSQC